MNTRTLHLSLLSRRIVFGVVILAFLATSVAPSARAAAPGDGTLALRVVTPNYVLGENGVSVDGYAWNDEPGAPRLPVYGTVVELPPTGGWTLDFTSANASTLPGRIDVRSVPVPALDLSGAESLTSRAELPGSVPTFDQPDPAIYNADQFYPASPIQQGEVQWMRGKRLLQLRVFPFQYNPMTKQVRYHPDLRITVQPSATAASTDAMPAGLGSQPTRQTAANELGALWIRTSQRGMHRITYNDLVNAGVAVASINPQSFILTNQGNQVRIRVTGEGDGQFNPGDLVIFFAEPYRTRYTTQNIYRLSYSNTPAAADTRIATRSITPTGSEPVVSAITQEAYVEVDKEYFSDYPNLAKEQDHFFDSAIVANSSSPVTTRTYNLSTLPAYTAGGTVQITGLLYGGTDQSPDPDQSVEVKLNSHSLGVFKWSGKTAYNLNTSGPSSWLDGAPNQLILQTATAQLPALAENWIYPDWLRMSYPALPQASNNQLNILGIDTAGTSAQITVSGFATNDVQAFDVRDPKQPVEVLTPNIVSNGPTFDATFWDQWNVGDPAPAYAVSTANGLLAPAAVTVDQLSSWGTPNHNADYIAIVHSNLWNAVQPLLDYRTGKGLQVAKVDVQDIYDEFNNGFLDPEAIREFLDYAYHNWNQGGDPPQYVLLVGDGHYDFRNATNTPLPNLIPPYLLDIDPWIRETAADNRFVSVDGPNDYMPDMAIGRIPAQTPADVTAVVDKILVYENPAVATPGDWQNRVVYVADDYENSAGNFHALSDDIRLNWLPASYDDRTVYYRANASLDTGEEVRSAIKQEFNNGAVYLQWFGHGSRFRWGSTSVFNILDPATLNPNNQMPLSATYACWTGYFINISFAAGQSQALGEQFLLQPGRASVADFSPSGLHIGGALSILDQGMTKAIFQDEVKVIGDAIDQAKQFYFANSANWPDVIDTMILFGDPATNLRLPSSDPVTPDISAKQNGNAADIFWDHLAPNEGYELWRDTKPYFDPALSEGVLVNDYLATSDLAGDEILLTDDGTNPPPTVQIIGDVVTNYFWTVLGVTGAASSSATHWVGEFDYQLYPGS